MHAAYNTQIMVFSGLISSFIITQSRNDLKDFIPLLEKHKEMYGNLPKSICADAGYGSLDNYEYMDKYNIENYVSKYRNMDSYEVIPYTKDGERRYLLIGDRLGDYYIIVCAVRDNSLVVLTKGNDRR